MVRLCTMPRLSSTLDLMPGLTSTVYREIFAVKKFLQLSVTAKITRTKIFQQ